ncbi:MAG: flagellar filament capping protein FliD [Angelakisella sp.]
MVGGIYSGYQASQMYSAKNVLSQLPASVNNFDYKAAQRDTQKLVDQYKAGQNTVKQMKKDTAQFLDDYTGSMKKLGSAADKLTNGKMDALLYGKGGTVGGVPTQENIDKTAAAVGDMVKQYNDSLTLLNKNSGRGTGVDKQLNRMAQSPVSKRSMEELGITTQKDGTLALNADKLKAALKESPATARDVLGGSFGIAQNISRSSTYGMSQSPAALVGKDIAKMQKQQTDSNPFAQMSTYSKSGAYNTMNMNSVGVLMNMMI